MACIASRRGGRTEGYRTTPAGGKRWHVNGDRRLIRLCRTLYLEGNRYRTPREKPTVLRGKSPLYSEGNLLYFKGRDTVPQGKTHCTPREETLYPEGKNSCPISTISMSCQLSNSLKLYLNPSYTTATMLLLRSISYLVCLAPTRCANAQRQRNCREVTALG